jgi:O-antigen ligase
VVSRLLVSERAYAQIGQSHEPDLEWDLLLLCVAGYMLTSVGRVHQLFPILEPVRPAVVSGILAIVMYLFDQQEPRRSVHLLVPTTKYLLALLVWMVLSVIGAIRQANSFDLLVGSFIKTVLMYFVVAASVRGIRDVQRLMLVYLVGGTIYAAVVITRFEVGAGDAWRLGHLYYYDANDFATLAVTTIPCGLYFLHAARGGVARLLAAVTLTVLTVAFVRAGSRGGFIALIVAAVFMLVRYPTIPPRWRLTGAALVALVLLGTATDQYWTQMGTILSDTDYNLTEENGRLQIWRRGVGYMFQYPIFGIGPDNFGVAEGTLSPLAVRQQFGIGVRWNAPHNTFVQVGAELGIPGLALFVAMIASAFVALRRSAARGTPGGAQLTPALTASLLSFVVGSFFLSLAYSDMLYMLVAFTAGLQKVTSIATA